MDVSALKLILYHQESRSLPNVDMVKFRALLGESSLHKKGTCSVSLSAVQTSRKWNTTNDTYLKKSLHDGIQYLPPITIEPIIINLNESFSDDDDYEDMEQDDELGEEKDQEVERDKEEDKDNQEWVDQNRQNEVIEEDLMELLVKSGIEMTVVKNDKEEMEDMDMETETMTTEDDIGDDDRMV
jgi:hypothetical protein